MLDEGEPIRLGAMLADEARWDRFRANVGREAARRVLYNLRNALLQEAVLAIGRAKKQAPAAKPAPAVKPAPAAKPAFAAKPEPPREAPWPGMPAAELTAWATAAHVADQLDVRAQRVHGAAYHQAAFFFFNARPNASVRDLVTAKPAANAQDERTGAPPAALGELVCRWLREVATRRAEALEQERAVLAARRPPADPALRGAWARLDAHRRSLREDVTPLWSGPGTRATIGFTEDPPTLRYTREGGVECPHAFGRAAVRVPLAGDAEAPGPCCECPGTGAGRCGVVLAGIDAAMAALEGRVSGMPTEPITKALATPAWQRTLADMDVLGALDPDEGGEVEIGWGVARDYHGFSLWPLRCTAKKRGDGWKVAKAREADVFAARGPTAAVDRLVFDSLPERDGPGSTRVARALERLAGHPRVFLDGKASQPVQVRVGALGIKLVAADDGGARLTPVVGHEPVAPAALEAEGDVWVAGDRIVRLDVDGGTVTVVHAPDPVRMLVASLARRGAVFPPQAVPELLRRLPAIARVVPVAAGDMITRLPAEPSWRLRLEALPDDTMRVELRVRPRPELPAEVPGEPPEEVFARGPDGVVGVCRGLAAEVAEAQALIGHVPLGAAIPEEPFTWYLVEPERVLDVVEALRAVTGVEIEWASPPRRVVRAAGGDGLSVRIGSAADWLALGGELRVEDLAVPLARLLEAIAARRPFVRVDERTWLRIGEHFRERLEGLADAAQDGALAPVNASALLALEEAGARVEAPPRWREHVARVRDAPTLEVPVPDGLRAELRPYQRAGFAWLARMATWSEGAVLADDMGLGKTVQALALLLRRAEAGPALVVAPTSVGFGWVEQAARFAPGLTVRLARGADRPRAEAPPRAGEVWVTSYDLLVRDADVLSGFSFATLVLDEAQAIKNAETHRAKAVRAIRADFRVALSGTPIENRTAELWSLFAAVAPGVFGGRERFRATYVTPIEAHGDTTRRTSLARRIRPFVLRRLKAEVAAELPPRTEVRVDVDLSPEERAVYDAARALAVSELSGAGGPESQRRIQILAALTRLRQIACHPRLVDAEAPPASAKLERLIELLRELRAEGRRVLVFSQFVRQLDLVADALATEGFRCCRLDGATPADERRARVEAFQRGEHDAFLISLKAGGAGLNLTAASDVVLLDPWWNPAVEDQAADRAHRIGQARAVTVYRLVARETVEERILAMHARKRDLVSAVLDGTGAAATLSVDELLALLRGDEAAPPEPAAAASRPPETPPSSPAASPSASSSPPPASSPSSPSPPSPPSPPPSLADRLAEHLAGVVAAGRLSPESAKVYRGAAARFVAYLEASGAAVAIRADDVDTWAQRYREDVTAGRWAAPPSAAKSIVAVARHLRDALAAPARLP